MPATAPQKNALIVWWVLWLAMINGLVLQRLFIGTGHSAEFSPLALVAIGPMFFSALIRIAALPRLTAKVRAFPLFIAGLAFAELGGLIGLFLAGDKADVFVGLSFVLLLSYMPLFAHRYDRADSDRDPFRQ